MMTAIKAAPRGLLHPTLNHTIAVNLSLPAILLRAVAGLRKLVRIPLRLTVTCLKFEGRSEYRLPVELKLLR